MRLLWQSFFCYKVYNLGLPATLLDSRSLEVCFFSAAIQMQWEGTAAVLPGPDAHGYARPAIVAVPALRAPHNVQLKRESATKSKLSSASLVLRLCVNWN